MRDVILDDVDFDILFESGDLVVSESTEQTVKNILLAATGDFREFPLLGVDVEKYIQSSDLEGFKRVVIENLKNDGFNIKQVRINDYFSVNIEVYE